MISRCRILNFDLAYLRYTLLKMKDQPTLNAHFGANSLIKVMDLHDYLIEQIFSIKDFEALPRTIVAWEREGIVEIKRGSKTEWRRVSFIEYLWIQFVHNLRELGIRVPIIAKVKETLLSPISLEWLNMAVLTHFEKDKLSNEDYDSFNKNLNLPKISIEEVSIFSLLAISCIVERSPISIIIFMDGTSIPWFIEDNQHWTEEMMQRKAHEVYISVPLMSLFRAYLTSPKTQFSHSKLNILNEDEQYLLEQVHSGKYSSITINFKDQKMKSLELVKEQDVKAKITDVIADASYQDITIKTHGGRVTKIENTVKVTF